MARGVKTRTKNDWASHQFLIALILVLSLYSFIATANYLRVSGLIRAPSILHPPVKFLVNVSAANVSNMTQVPLNQTFCPESAAIRKAASAVNRYLYYTFASPGQNFRYSLIYDSANYTFAYAAVLPPFKLNYYKNIAQSRPDCAGYPNAFGNATLSIQAPNASYYGPMYAVLYFSKK